MLKEPTVSVLGTILVEVPAEMVRVGSAFSFPLPKELAELAAATAQTPQVTLADGRPLPTWLRYRPKMKQFVATNVPGGALPIQVLLKIGATRTVMFVRVRGQ